jgi:cytochrome c-type biogenesis protein CcsB
METGISPFITISESITFGMFMAVLIFLIFEFSNKKVRPLGVLVMPVAFVLMGWAGTLVKGAATQLAPALQSAWIWVHIIGAATGFGAVLTAAGLGLMYLLREKNSGGIYAKLPELQALDNLGYRFVAGGFIMYGLMIVSGAFWANQVKGSYWNWDPVEVWSLISWLIYGIYLHLRITFGWRGRRLAWYALVALVAMIVSYWGIPFAVETFHSGFRIEH